MSLLKQIFSDIKKEIGWVIFYGLLAMIVLVTLIYMGDTFDTIASDVNMLKFLEKNNVTIITREQAKYDSDPIKSSPNYDIANVERIDEYFTSEFSADGKAGSMVIMHGYFGYDNVIVILGAYADIMPCPVELKDPVTFVASYDTKDTKPDTIKLVGKEYPLYLAYKQMQLLHPAYYQMNTTNGSLDNTLYVYSQDYTAFKEMFPSNVYWDLTSDQYFNIFILKNAADEDVLRLRNVVSKNSGAFLYASTVKEYMGSGNVDDNMRTAQIKMMFYIISSVALIGAMIMNIYRVVKRKIPEYVTHHLFGASEAFIFARMFIFALLYHVLPIGGTVYTLSRSMKVVAEYGGNSVKTTLLFVSAVIIIFTILFTISYTAFARFRKSFTESSGRE